jgi:hypothetical protein
VKDVIETMKPDLDRTYVPTSEAQKMSGFSRSYLGLLLRNGEIDGFRLGREWFLYVDSLNRFLEKPRKPGPKGSRKKAIRDVSSTSPAHSSSDENKRN